MARVPLPIANGYYKSDSLPISHQECMNLYPYILQGKEGLNKQTLFGCPGMTQVVTSGSASSDANRGSTDLKGVPYHVNGSSLYQQGSDDTLTTLGTIGGTGRVSMADNGTQLMVIAQNTGYPSTTGYIYDVVEEQFSEITDPDFYQNGNPTMVRYVDGYFICVTDTGKHIISSLNDGTGWNGLDFGSAEVDPDPTYAVEILNNQPYIFGAETVEGFVNRPVGADYPFQRSGVFAEKGTRSPFSVRKFQSRIFFVGGGRNESASIWMYDGSAEPVKISDEGIDSILHRLTNPQLEAIHTWAYAQKGFFFVGFVLPTTTLVYELGSGLWHERKSYVTYPDSSVGLTRYRVSAVVPAYGKLYVSDFVDGRIGYLDIDIYSEYGENIRRSFSTQPFQNQGMAFRVPALELTIESGTGEDDGDDEPYVEMSRSMDGRTWLTPRPRKMGRVGQYYKRQIWRKLGLASRFEVFKFTFSAKVKTVAIQLSADILPCFK